MLVHTVYDAWIPVCNAGVRRFHRRDDAGVISFPLTKDDTWSLLMRPVRFDE